MVLGALAVGAKPSSIVVARQPGITEAVRPGDDLLVEAQQAEIDDLRRTAASHGIDVPRCA